MSQTIRAIGKLSYDEGTLKSISAYVDGRIERLYADFTGAVVRKGDQLALVYSPRLYSSQVEFLLARRAYRNSRSSTLKRVSRSNRDIYESSRTRLVELGLTEPQIRQLEESGEADSRMHVCAPISGTIIEKLAAEGDYLKEGQAIYKLADLSTLWLMLELFPDDAASIRYGQKVEAEMQSARDQKFVGRVTFIDPHVDSSKRTVGVRVVIANPAGNLRVGDYAKATINVPLSPDGEQRLVFDPELAKKWIGPRHPHIVESAPGNCPICDAALVPAADFGFTDEPLREAETLVVPRNAVLMAGANSVVYVETDPGRFEIRQVVLGPSCGDQIVIRSGVKNGEDVAIQGNFLIDSQMQLAGNPSLIDPTKDEPRFAKLTADPQQTDANTDQWNLPPIGTPQLMEPQLEPAVTINKQEDKVAELLSELSETDRELVQKQKICPVADQPLGSMGTPIKVNVKGRSVFICCEGCRERLLADPDRYLAKLPREATR